MPFKSGGEGDIYELDQKFLAKIYYPDMINDERRFKVLSLCTSFSDNINHFGTDSFAFPQKPAYEDKEVFDSLSGFSMSYYKDCSDLNDVCFDLLHSNDFQTHHGYKFDDATAVDLIYNIFGVVDRLHKSRIILGDVNPGNILYDRNSGLPVIIDLDSAQIGRLRCLAHSMEYLDPLIQEQGADSQGRYTYNFESDIFSIACVCYEFFVGANPFFVQTKPPNSIPHNKENGICGLRFYHGSTPVLNGVQYLSTKTNSDIETRLEVLRVGYPELFEFFVSIFIDNGRTSLLYTLNRNDPRHPAYTFYSQSGFDKVLEQMIEDQKESIDKHESSPQINRNVNGFVLPDSGFSKILQNRSVDQLSTNYNVALKKNNQSGFDKVLEQMIEDQKESIDKHESSPQINRNVNGFVLPDSGFSKILQNRSVDQSSTNYNVVLKKNNDSDPKELTMFLSNYGSDISEMIRGD